MKNSIFCSITLKTLKALIAPIIFFIIVTIFIFTVNGCSTSKHIQQENNKSLEKKSNNNSNNSNSNNNGTNNTISDIEISSKILNLEGTEKENLTFQARINLNFPQINQTISATIELAGVDSILIKIYGPLGIPVGKLYSNKNFYIMSNYIESITFTGSPTAENLQKIINLPLEFDDIVYLLRSSLPTHDSENIFQSVGVEAEGDLYFRKNKENGEFAIINSSGQLVHFQRKITGDDLVLSAKYSNFIKIGDKSLAKNIYMNFPVANGKATIEYTDIKSGNINTAPMIFTKPQSHKLIELK